MSEIILQRRISVVSLGFMITVPNGLEVALTPRAVTMYVLQSLSESEVPVWGNGFCTTLRQGPTF